MKNNFNKISIVYDRLARLVFGNQLHSAQKVFLAEIPENSHVLVVGGGTGWILNALDDLNKSLNVVFVDASSRMIDKAKRRVPFKNLSVSFIEGSYDAEVGLSDVIITNFFLDVFQDTNLPLVIGALKSRLKESGQWLVTDFEKGAGRWQNALIAFMYLFFRWTTNLEGRQLLDFNKYLNQYGLYKIKSIKFHHGMIRSSVYKRL